MAAYFFDSSALVKRYARETGTAWVLSVTDPTAGHAIYAARITGVEVVSALTRQARNGVLLPAVAATALVQFRYDLAHQYLTVDITPTLIARVMGLAELHALRGYDAVQCAAALVVHAYRQALGMSTLTLVSADDTLNRAAAAEGLLVDDPNVHPWRRQDPFAPNPVRGHFELRVDRWAFGDHRTFSYVTEEKPAISVEQAISLYDLYEFYLGSSVRHIPTRSPRADVKLNTAAGCPQIVAYAGPSRV